MNLALDFLTGLVAFVMTLMVLSYLLGDNPLFRFSSYLFVGVAAGYVAAVAWHQVLYPGLVVPLRDGDMTERMVMVFPLLLSVMLLGTITPRLSRLGRPVLAMMVGVGAATAVGGVVSGTLLPLTVSTFSLPSIYEATTSVTGMERLLDGVVILVGTLATLLYFQFSVNPQRRGRRSRLMTVVAWLGQVFIAIALGVLFAGAFAAAFGSLVERVTFLYDFIFSLVR